MDSTSVLKFWFVEKKNKWFPKDGSNAQKEMDLEVIHKYKETINICEWHKSPHGLMALIIVFDQFTRHEFRGNRVKIALYDNIALGYSKKMIENGWMELLTDAQFMFACMPFRHASNPNSLATISRKCEYLRMVKQLIDTRILQRHNNGELLKNFWKVTHEKQIQLFKDVKNSEFHDTDILDNNAMYVGGPVVDRVYDECIYKTVASKVNSKSPHYISLSGGVDSMVLAYILNITGILVIGIHIDYGNRLESSAEARFVKNWCESQTPPIIFRVKRIEDKFRRGVTDRHEYEEETKLIRFKEYQKALDEYSHGKGCINLGHNWDDIPENVLSNIATRKSILGLSGMQESNIINGVSINRPLLSIKKSDIFAFAHKFHIPYMKDTTPRYCVRGMLRHEVKPLLEKVYGTGILQSFNAMAIQSDKLATLTDSLIFEPFMKTVFQCKLGLYVNYTGFENHGYLFWKECITRMCHMMGVSSININIVRTKLEPNLVSNETVWDIGKVVNVCIADNYLYIIKSGKRSWNISSFTASHVISKYSKKISLKDIMSGQVFYVLPYLTHNQIAIEKIVSTDKKLMPWCFRGNGLDKRMKSMLPILCINSLNYPRNECVNDSKYRVFVKIELV
jgi:tRNA(Ile)-lysidine synthetase-like protein